MRLKSFRVTNYRNIRDSGEILLDDDILCLVGQNRAGKSNLLRGLAGLNPASNSLGYRMDRDTPTDMTKSWANVVSTATFETEEGMHVTINRKRIKGIREVTVSRDYGGNYSLKFLHDGKTKTLDSRKITEIIASVDTQELISQNNRVKKILYQNAFLISRKIQIEEMDYAIEILKNIEDFKNLNSNEENLLRDTVEYISNRNFDKFEEQDKKLFQSVLKALPVFHFHSADPAAFKIETPNAASAVDELLAPLVSGLITGSQDGSSDPVLATVVSDAATLTDGNSPSSSRGESDSSEPAKQATFDLDAIRRIEGVLKLVASRAFPGGNVRLVVRTSGSERDGLSIEGIDVDFGSSNSALAVESESDGFKVSFENSIMFERLTRYGYRNSIVLLDEPDAFLHATTQKHLVEAFENYTDFVQIIYATHSPFMVQHDKLYRAWVVDRSEENGAKVTRGLNIENIGDLGAISAAFGIASLRKIFEDEIVIVVSTELERALIRKLLEKIEPDQLNIPGHFDVVMSKSRDTLGSWIDFLRGRADRILVVQGVRDQEQAEKLEELRKATGLGDRIGGITLDELTGGGVSSNDLVCVEFFGSELLALVIDSLLTAEEKLGEKNEKEKKNLEILINGNGVKGTIAEIVSDKGPKNRGKTIEREVHSRLVSMISDIRWENIEGYLSERTQEFRFNEAFIEKLSKMSGSIRDRIQSIKSRPAAVQNRIEEETRDNVDRESAG